MENNNKIKKSELEKLKIVLKNNEEQLRKKKESDNKNSEKKFIFEIENFSLEIPKIEKLEKYKKNERSKNKKRSRNKSKEKRNSRGKYKNESKEENKNKINFLNKNKNHFSGTLPIEEKYENPFDIFIKKRIKLRNDFDQINSEKLLFEKELAFQQFQMDENADYLDG